MGRAVHSPGYEKNSLASVVVTGLRYCLESARSLKLFATLLFAVIALFLPTAGDAQSVSTLALNPSTVTGANDAKSRKSNSKGRSAAARWAS